MITELHDELTMLDKCGYEANALQTRVNARLLLAVEGSTMLLNPL